MNITLAQNIKRLRGEKNITQKGLADILSITPQSVSRWENGLAYPDIEMLPRLASFFDISVDDLLGTGVSFVQKKRQELLGIRSKLNNAVFPERRMAECDVLEELAARGYEQVDYFRVVMGLFHDGYADAERVEKAREYCRQMLKDRGAEERNKLLSHILSYEEDDHIGTWREFITGDPLVSGWDDVLLLRLADMLRLAGSGASEEKWEKQRQKVVVNALWKLIFQLTADIPRRVNDGGTAVYDALGSYDSYRLAMDALNLFSQEETDGLIRLRLHVEIRMARVLFRDGRTEEGFALLEKIRSQVTYLRNSLASCGGKTAVYRGSIPSLAAWEQEIDEDTVNCCLADLCFQEKRYEFKSVRADHRFVEFFSYISNMDATDAQRFKEMLDLARTVPRGSGEEVMVLMMPDGTCHSAVIANEALDAAAEGRDNVYQTEFDFIGRLEAEGMTAVSYVVNLGQGGCVMLPSCPFCRKLRELCPDNQKTKMLLGTWNRYHAKTVEEVLPPQKSNCKEKERE